ncbi:MAG: BRCT domain-containing protein [Oligoflexales bacterium]
MRQKHIKALAESILHHKRLYYAGNPEISDAEFDNIEHELKTLEPHHPALQAIGYTPLKNKLRHSTPMLSLEKTYDCTQLIQWANKIDKKRFPHLIATWKIDGNSLSLVYENGVLVQAKTRGNGIEGEDVLDKIQWVTSCPKNLRHGSGEIRGELVCHQKEFEDLKQEMQRLGLETPSNPRNIVAGVLGRKKHEDLARFFDFYAFDSLLEDAPFQTEKEKMSWLHTSDFQLPDYEYITSEEELKKVIEDSKTKALSLHMAVDGVVITVNDLLTHKELGYTAHHPRYKISFKWQGETATAKINNIHWATSPYGVITPVAEIEPTPLSGATISNVTLHNADLVQTQNLAPGDYIEIIRSGEVIPKFLSIQHNHPKQCHLCQKNLVWDNENLLCHEHSSLSQSNLPHDSKNETQTFYEFDELKRWVRRRVVLVEEIFKKPESLHIKPNIARVENSKKLREIIFQPNDNIDLFAIHLEKQKTKVFFKSHSSHAYIKIKKVEWLQNQGSVQQRVHMEDHTHFFMHTTAQALKHNLHTGDSIWVAFQNQQASFIDRSQAACLPKSCPSCKDPIAWDNDEVRLICCNQECAAQVKGQILKWIRAVEIDDISEKRIHEMLDKQLMKTAPDLYRLTYDGLLTLPMVGDKLARKLLDHIEHAKQVPLVPFLCGLGISGTGTTTWEKVTAVYPSLTELQEVTPEQLCQIDGFSEITSTQVVEGLKSKQDFINELFQVGVRILTPALETSLSQKPFQGLRIAITGTLSRPRKELSELIKNLGGEIASSISQTTHALVIADTQSTSTKAKKARELGVLLWSEEDLILNSQTSGKIDLG